jgi:hypothetical protein
MSNPFFDHPILNSPYDRPMRHWELDHQGQPTQQLIETRRQADFITPIPKPKKRKTSAAQDAFVFDEGKGLSTKAQQYDPTSIINAARRPGRKLFSRGFLVCTTGITIKDWLGVLQPNDPYRYGSETRKHFPDFIALVDDGHGPDALLHLVVEIKGYRREDAKEKKAAMDTYWVPGVNHLKTYGRWAFAEFREVHQMEADFKAKIENEFNNMIERAAQP